MRPAVADLTAVGLDSVDAYNLFPLLNNYVFAWLAARESDALAAAPEAPEPAPRLHFPGAGLLKLREPRYELYVGIAKGGVLKLFDRERRRLALSDCGYIGRLRSGALISTQAPDPNRRVQISGEEICIEGRLTRVTRPVWRPPTFLAFRLFTLTLGRVRGIAGWLKALLVRVLITRSRELPIRFSRRIRLRPDGIDVEDRLWGPGGEQIERLAQQDVFTTIHMGSSRYFVPNQLGTADWSESDAARSVDVRQLATGVERRRSVRLDRREGEPG
jgi:hypothetical protein